MATETPGGPAGAPDPGAGPQSPAGAEAPPAYGGGQVVQQQSAVGPRSGFWRRFAAAFIDGLLTGIGLVILTAALKGAGYAIGFLLTIGYYVYFEGSASGQTVGKRALGIRVIDFDTGGPIGPGRALIRYLGRILSAIPLYLGYFWMLWDDQKQTWHDKLSNAVVVPQDAYPVEKWPG